MLAYAQSDRQRTTQAVNAALNNANALAALGSLESEGHGLVSAPAVTQLLKGVAGPELDVDSFRSSWNGMATDTFLADGGAYRQRTFATFKISKPGGAFERTEPRPHFQALEFNPVNGGVDRVFQPTPQEVFDMPITHAILEGFRAISESLSPTRRWWLEFHQFRVTASANETGQPTPEGLHRDGVDFGLVMLVARENICGGRTTITDPDGVTLREFTMRDPFETLLLDDPQVRHGVSGVTPTDPSKPAFRDTLVITLRALT